MTEIQFGRKNNKKKSVNFSNETPKILRIVEDIRTKQNKLMEVINLLNINMTEKEFTSQTPVIYREKKENITDTKLIKTTEITLQSILEHFRTLDKKTFKNIIMDLEDIIEDMA